MTLEQAHWIAEIATDAFASKPSGNFCPTSKFRGRSFVEISKAYSLVIAARRQIAADENEMKTACEKFASLASQLVASLEMMVITDEEFNHLANLPEGSNERKRVLLEVVQNRKRNEEQGRELAKEETAASFNSFCWTLDYRDPLYWQKVYTHLRLPYDERCPIGQPKPAQSDGKESFFFPSVINQYTFDTPVKRREQRLGESLVILIIVVLVGFFVWRFFF